MCLFIVHYLHAVVGYQSEQTPDSILPERLANFCPITVHVYTFTSSASLTLANLLHSFLRSELLEDLHEGIGFLLFNLSAMIGNKIHGSLTAPPIS
jgi:hypothetical protein